MPIELDHLIVPPLDRRASAHRLAQILDVPWAGEGVGPFSPVFVHDGLTLDFDQAEGEFATLHFAFRLDEAEFDVLVARLQSLGVAFRGRPHGENDGRIGSHLGGRLVYWNEPDGHVWEALTVSYARRPAASNDDRAPTGAARS